MKTMTCSQMGGPCGEKISAASKEEMMMNGMKHLEDKHPDVAEMVKAAAQTDPMMVSWREKFDREFEAAPEM